MIKEIPILYLILPCYNEEDTLEYSIEKIMEKLGRLVSENKISVKSKALFVNDGSKDKTLSRLHEEAAKDNRIAVVSLASNRGHQNAILAGMMVAKEYCDIAITIDVDLQQDIEALDKFIEKYNKGSEVVYGIRNDRKSDGFMKKTTASMYYKLMHAMGADVMTNHADYRLMSKKALDMLSEYEETNLFLRGLIPTMGFNSDIVYFDVKEREFGKSKYTIKKMFTLALDGITSMSTRPLHMISVLGFLVFLFSVVLAIVTLVDYFRGNNVQGYTTSIIVSLLIGGVTLLSLGVIGEYIGKVYMEAKHRPRYMIDSVVIKDMDEK